MLSITASARDALEGAFGAMNGGDPEALIGAYAGDGVVLVGTRADDWHESTAAIGEALRAEAGAVTADWDLRELDLGPGAAAVVGRMVFTLPGGVTLPVRATYAMRREQEGWRIVHSHLSVAHAV
jgi:ketosteroid isomerase-like protein